jgi:uncharacterized delta-60 repeat protein
VAVDSHNRVILAGYISYSLVDWDFAVARLTEAGGIDTSFNGNGKLTFSFSTGLETAKGVVIDAQDRIVIAGTATASGGMNVARVTTAGVLDPSFDGDGMATISFPGINTGAEGVAIDSLGRIVLAGSGGNPSEMAVACLTDAGIPDPSFDGDGLQTIAFGTTSCEGHSVAIDAFDRVVVAGDTVVGSFEKFAVARLTSAGALDSTFDGDGEQTVAFGTADEQAYGVAIDSQNRVVMTGFTNNGSNKDFAVTRLTSAGALDTSFDGDGKLTIAFGSFDETASSVAIAIGNRVIVAGSTDFDGKLFALARLTGDITTASAQVNDGAAQRSRVTSLTVRFSGQVTFSGSPDLAFTLVRNGGGSVSFTATVSVQNGGTVVTLDHFTGPDTEFGSLADGRYTLTALASQISVGGQALDGDADGTAGGNFVFNDTQGLFRLFGDVNGDQTVNGFDLGFFRNAFGTQTGDSNYLSYLDLNGDGVINGFDLGQFRTRFGTMLP